MDLLGAMRREYSACKRLRYRYDGCLLAALLIIALITCNPLPAPWSQVLAITALIVQIARVSIRVRAASHGSAAESIRHRLLLCDGFGTTLPHLQSANVLATAGDLANDEPPPLGLYYHSERPPGPERLAELLAESAFYTKHNADWLWRKLALITGIVLVSCLGLLLFAVYLASPATMQRTATVFIAAMLFWAAGDITALTLTFYSLAAASQQTLTDCEHFLERPPLKKERERTALLYATDYAVALAKTPPIPSRVYKKHQARLDQSWQQRHGQS